MSIFSKIRDAIFHPRTAPAAPAGTPATVPTSTASTTPASPATTAPPAAPMSTPLASVDVEAVLSGLAARAGQKLNWRTSIVDLMKLLGMESSLAERKELATELGYTGNTQDSAAMNLWLHKQVMKKLAENGGKVPADLLD